jgi:ATP-dependent helicase/nuclease subunit A
MVDEFQDNNRLQRDLIFLLAEKFERTDPGIPKPEELRDNVMFFVGDEKQSIYRFRGADVSVFRSLAQSLSPAGTPGGALNLIRNYRSRPILIDAFNRVFGGLDPQPGGSIDSGKGAANDAVFLPEDEQLPIFEAAYHRVYALQPKPLGETGSEERENPPLYFCFLDKHRIDKTSASALAAHELEAAYIAGNIREMVDSGYRVRERGNEGIKERPCNYGDFAILQRSYTHQNALEKHCKNFGVPFTADRPAGLFSDAPVNDLLMFLRLLVYPEDRLAYAALIRSPFMRLSDVTLSVCLLNNTAVPFDEALDGIVPPEEQELYRLARQRYSTLAEEAHTLPVVELLTKLWYDEGYRYETIWSEASQIYGELFDLFFELTLDVDRRGKSLADFLDYLDDLINQEEKIDALSIPAEEDSGVRIMSIHKSKGLEFPVVVVYCCGSRGRNDTNTEAVYFSQQWGITINLPQGEELPDRSGNYFFNQAREEEERKRIAELRRLLYVAMNMAESCLFLTASLDFPAAGEEAEDSGSPDGEYTIEAVMEGLVRLKAKIRDRGTAASFTDLLIPAMVSDAGEKPPFSIEIIPVLSREELKSLTAGLSSNKSGANTMRDAAEAAVSFYAGAELITTPPPALTVIPASGLRSAEADSSSAGDNAAPGSRVDRILEWAGLEAADFGTIVHGFLEDRFRGVEPRIPPRIQARLEDSDLAFIHEAAENMARGFLDSGIGKLSLKAAYRESEFPIITLAETGAEKIHITGQIDLLFEWEGIMHIVDFKTDRVEQPEQHYAQLAVYQRAVSDIFEKPVRSWLFYLRNSNTVEVTEKVRAIDIEATVKACSESDF